MESKGVKNSIISNASNLKQKSKFLFYSIISCGGLLFLCISCTVISMIFSSGTNTSSQNKAEIKVSPTASISPSPSKTLTKDEQIESDKQAIKAKLEKVKILGKLKEIKVMEESDGSYTVNVYINMIDLMNLKGTQSQANFDMSDLYIAIYKENKPLVKKVVMGGYLDVTDKYGNDTTIVAYQTSLNIEEANKVNWSQDKSNLGYSILPSVWSLEKNKLPEIYK